MDEFGGYAVMMSNRAMAITKLGFGWFSLTASSQQGNGFGRSPVALGKTQSQSAKTG